MADTLSLELRKADLGPLISWTRGENTCVLQGAAVIGHSSWGRQTHADFLKSKGSCSWKSGGTV